jgi:anti-sigma factor RsiW
MSSPLSEKDRAELVAYLDGELDAQASQAVEARLSRDATARAEVDQLRRTWELLDFLPRPEPSASFTHRTMERLGPTPTAAQPRPTRFVLPRWAFGTGWAAAVLLAMVGGYIGLSALLNVAPPPRYEPTDQDLVRDLRVIENKRFYELAHDLEFLKDLDHPDLFGEDAHGS